MLAAGCPGDDSGDDVGDSATTEASTTTTTTTTTTTSSTTDDGMTSTGMPDDTTGELILGDIEVTVNYDGMETGLLQVVAVPQWPPLGPPVAAASEMDPSYPWMGTLTGLEEGEWFIAAVLDVGESNPTMPGPEDLVSVSKAPVVVDGEGPFMIELTLTDVM